MEHVLSSFPFKLKIRYSFPKPCQILVFENRTGAALTRTVLEGMDHMVLDTRFKRYPDQVCRLNLRVIWKMLEFRFSEKVGWVDAYLMAWISVSKARVVLDRSHNLNLSIYSGSFPQTQFFLVQNGSWLLSLDPAIESPRFIQKLTERAKTLRPNLHICCFGQNDIDKITGGSDSPSFQPLPIGSLLGDCYFNDKPVQTVSPVKYKICLCSQAVPARIAKGGALGKRRLQAYELIDEYLVRFCEENGINAVIAPRKKCGDDDWEKEHDFHQKFIASSEKVHVSKETGFDATYELMNQSEIVLSLYSTTGFEAIKWGKKVMFCPFYHGDVFKASSQRFVKDADCWPWWLDNPDYEFFEEMLLSLLEISPENYLTQTQEAAVYLSSYGSEISAHELLRSEILTALENKEVK